MSRMMIIHIVAPRLIPANHAFHILTFSVSHFEGITVAPIIEILKFEGNGLNKACVNTPRWDAATLLAYTLSFLIPLRGEYC